MFPTLWSEMRSIYCNTWFVGLMKKFITMSQMSVPLLYQSKRVGIANYSLELIRPDKCSC